MNQILHAGNWVQMDHFLLRQLGKWFGRLILEIVFCRTFGIGRLLFLYPSFTWRLLNKWISVDEIMQRRGHYMASKCCSCWSLESISHVFIHCKLAYEVRKFFSALFKLQVPEVSNIQLAMQYWRSSTKSRDKNHIRANIPVLVYWSLWRERNDAKYNSIAPSKHKAISRILSYLVAANDISWSEIILLDRKLEYKQSSQTRILLTEIREIKLPNSK